MKKIFFSPKVIILSFLLITAEIGRAESMTPDPYSPRQAPKVETIFRYAIGSAGIAFQVNSGGCTDKSSFTIQKSLEGSETKLTLVRVVPDYCKARMPGGVIVLYSFEELNLNPRSSYQVDNPLLPE